MLTVKSKWVYPLSPSPHLLIIILITRDQWWLILAKNQMNQMIIKYCRHKSDIVVVFETVIMYLSLSSPAPAQGPHNGDNEVTDNDPSSAASAVTFLFHYPQPPLDTPGSDHPRSHGHHTMVTGQTMQIIRAGWSLILQTQIFPKIVTILQRDTADVDAVTDSRNASLYRR